MHRIGVTSAWYRDLGLNIIDPDAEALEYSEELSLENALKKYPSGTSCGNRRGRLP